LGEIPSKQEKYLKAFINPKNSPKDYNRTLYPKEDDHMKFTDRLANGMKGMAIGGAAGASMGGSIVSAVCSVGGTLVGPIGTFFGAAVGGGAGASVGGTLGAISGFVGGFLEDDDACNHR
jgi:phage tail tape-measure protein